jgi:methylglyoxal synthase
VGKVLNMRGRRSVNQTVVALIAPEVEKDELLRRVESHVGLFRAIRRAGPAPRAGSMVTQQLSLTVLWVDCGTNGDDEQIGVVMVDGRVGAVVLVREPEAVTDDEVGLP